MGSTGRARGSRPAREGVALATEGWMIMITEVETTEAMLPIAPLAPAPPAPGPPPDVTITYDQFSAVDLRVGVVRTCERIPKKDKLLRLTVDVGEPELRIIVAGLALSFQPEQLIDRRLVVVVNLAPRDFGKGVVSHGMILATGASEKLTLATVAGDAAAGDRLR